MTQPNDTNLSPAAVNQLHRNADRDSSKEALHHTLGPLPYQSSPGDHSHDGRSSKILSGLSVITHSHDASDIENTPSGGLTSVDVQAALEELEGEIVGHTHPSVVYVQDTAPVGVLPSKYLWVQTNMGAGEDITFWIEDGD